MWTSKWIGGLVPFYLITTTTFVTGLMIPKQVCNGTVRAVYIGPDSKDIELPTFSGHAPVGSAQECAELCYKQNCAIAGYTAIPGMTPKCLLSMDERSRKDCSSSYEQKHEHQFKGIEVLIECVRCIYATTTTSTTTTTTTTTTPTTTRTTTTPTTTKITTTRTTTIPTTTTPTTTTTTPTTTTTTTTTTPTTTTPTTTTPATTPTPTTATTTTTTPITTNPTTTTTTIATTTTTTPTTTPTTTTPTPTTPTAARPAYNWRSRINVRRCVQRSNAGLALPYAEAQNYCRSVYGTGGQLAIIDSDALLTLVYNATVQLNRGDYFLIGAKRDQGYHRETWHWEDYDGYTEGKIDLNRLLSQPGLIWDVYRYYRSDENDCGALDASKTRALTQVQCNRPTGFICEYFC